MTIATRPIGYVSDAWVGPGSFWAYDPNETTPELQWPQSVYVYDQMRRQDAQVGSVLEAVCRPVLRTPWRIDPAGARDEVVQFVAEDLGLPIVGENPDPPARTKDRFSWLEHLELALLMLPFGHMYFEQLYRVADDGSKAHLGKLEPRMPRTIEAIDVARDGGLVSITQCQIYGGAQKPIPVDRLVAYIYKREGANWLGRSILRQAYKNWLIKDRLLRVQAQTIERNGMGVPRYTDAENATPTQHAEGLAMAKAWRSGEAAGAAIPFGAKLDLVGVEGELPDALPAIKYHDEQIARAVLAHFLNLDNQSHGSYALGTSFMDFFTLSLQTLAQSVADVASMHIVEDLVDVNWGPKEPAPRITFDEIGSRQAATAQSVKSLVDAGIVTPDERLEESSRQQYGLPPADPETARDNASAGGLPPIAAGGNAAVRDAIDTYRGGRSPSMPKRPTGAQPVAASFVGRSEEEVLLDLAYDLTRAALDDRVEAAGQFNPDLHPRGSRGRFRTTLDRIIDGLRRWADGGGEGDPFEGFEREPLRRTAVTRGITLRRGATREEISDALLADLRDALDGGDRDSGHRLRRLDEVHPVGVGRTRTRGRSARRAELDLEEAARARQADLDEKRGIAELLSEVEELHHDQASVRAMQHRIRGTAVRGRVADDIREELLAATTAARDSGALERTIDRIASNHSLTRVLRAGDRVRFDPDEHELLGGFRSPEQRYRYVDVLRPGYRTTAIDGTTVRIHRPTVLEVNPGTAGRTRPRATEPNASEIRQQLLSMAHADRFAYLEDLGLNQAQTRRLARGLGVRGQDRSTAPEVIGRIVSHFEGADDEDALARLGGGPTAPPATPPQSHGRSAGLAPVSSPFTTTSVRGVTLDDRAPIFGNAPIHLGVTHQNGAPLGDVHGGQHGGDWSAFPPTGARWGLQGDPGSGRHGFSSQDEAVQALLDAYNAHQRSAGQPPRSRRSRSADGLDAMDDRDLHDLAMEYSIPPVGLGTADRTGLIRRLRDAGATAPGSQVQPSRRPSVGLRMSLLLNTWANGDGPDDPLEESGFTRDQLRAAARSRSITLPRGASEQAIRRAIYDSVRTPARQRRANAGSLTPMGDLFGRQMTEAARQARVREVFEGDFGGLTTHVDDVHHVQRARAFGGGNDDAMSVRGHVRDSSGHQVGTFSRQYHQQPDGTITAYHAYLQISGSVQGNGFSNAFNGHLINWYRRSGVQSVSVHADIDVGGYTWASFGYDFSDSYEADAMIDRFRDALRNLEQGRYRGRRLRGQGMQEDQQIAALRALLARTRSSRFGQPGYPTAYEFSQAGRWEGASGRSDVWIGKALMLGTSWHGRLDLTTPSPTGS